jgi:hypothetical protein
MFNEDKYGARLEAYPSIQRPDDIRAVQELWEALLRADGGLVSKYPGVENAPEEPKIEHDIITDTIGVAQGIPFDVEEAMKGANPNFSMPNAKAEGYTRNCQRSVPTYELRRRGYNVEALPRVDSSYNQGFKDVASVYNNPQIQKITMPGGTRSATISAELEKQVEAWGENARAQVVVAWKGGGGHTFVVENVNGKAVLIDPQTNKQRPVNDYIDKAKKNYIYYWRMDNIDFNTDALPKITKAKEIK